MNIPDKIEIMGRDTVLVSRHSLRVTDKNHEKLQSGLPVIRPIFDAGTSRLKHILYN